MNIYCISGLGADKRVFDHLNIINHDLKYLEWIDPFPNESIETYARRLSKGIDQDHPFILLGVSFGGIIAIEIAKITTPIHTIQISSVDNHHVLPKLYRLIGKTRLIRMLPKVFFNIPAPIAALVFKTANKKLLSAILRDTKTSFTKWAVNAILNWKNDQTIDRIIRIGGERDIILPPTKYHMDHIIKGGGHFMIVVKADEISDILNRELLRL